MIIYRLKDARVGDIVGDDNLYMIISIKDNIVVWLDIARQNIFQHKITMPNSIYWDITARLSEGRHEL